MSQIDWSRTTNTTAAMTSSASSSTMVTTVPGRIAGTVPEGGA